MRKNSDLCTYKRLFALYLQTRAQTLNNTTMYITKENRKKFLAKHNFEALVANIAKRKDERIKEILEDKRSQLSTLKAAYDKARKDYQACIADIVLKDSYISDERGRVVKKAVLAICAEIKRGWNDTKGFIFWFNANNKDGFESLIDTPARLYSVADSLLEEYTSAKLGKKKNTKYVSDDDIIKAYSYKVSLVISVPAARNRKIRNFTKLLPTLGSDVVNRFIRLYLKDCF